VEFVIVQHTKSNPLSSLDWAVHVIMEKHASLLFKSLNGMGTFYRVDLMSAVFSLNGRFFLS